MSPAQAGAGLVRPVTQQQIGHGVPEHGDSQRPGGQIARQAKNLVGVNQQEIAERVVLHTKCDGRRAIVPERRLLLYCFLSQFSHPFSVKTIQVNTSQVLTSFCE